MNLEVVSSDRDARWAAPRPTLPTPKAVEKVAEMLMGYGHHELTAYAIARAAPDPAGLRSSLSSPIHRQVEGGTLVMVRSSVWSAAIAPSPTNPRMLPRLTYPFGAPASSTARVPLPHPTAFPGGFGLQIVVDSPEHLSAHLASMADELVEENPWDVSGGVRAPVSIVPTIVRHRDGSPEIAFLPAADGSTRVALVHKAHRYRQADVLYGFAGQDRSYRSLRSRIGDVLELEDRDREALSENERTRLRTLTIPAELIIGFIPTSEGADLPSAIDSLVGQAHVDPPTPWAPAAQLDAQVDAAADALVRAGKISPTEGAYVRAMVTVEEAAEAELPIELDARAIQCFVWLTNKAHTKAVNKGLRTLRIVVDDEDSPRILKGERVRVGVEAALRPFRSSRGMSRQAAETARTALREGWSMDEIADYGSWELTGATPEELLDAALKENDEHVVGPAARELLALAIWWLAVYGTVRPATRGGQQDRRALTTVLREVVRKRNGLSQLYQAIVDGRDGMVPRRLGENGRPLVTDAGRCVEIDDRWLRHAYPSHSEDASPESTTSPIQLPALSPEEELMNRRERLGQTVRTMNREATGLEEPTDESGRPYVQSEGLPPNFVDEMTNILLEVQGKLALYKHVWSNARPSTIGGDIDQDEDEDVAEERGT